MIIRKAEISDAGKLLEIYAYYVENTAISFEYKPPSTDEFRNRIENTLKAYPYIVLEKDGVIQGYAYAGEFGGRAAYRHSAEVTIYLNRDARGKMFHQHIGFNKVGEFHKCGYKFGRWYNMIWMEKIVGEHR